MTFSNNEHTVHRCWYCGAPLVWDCDYDYADVFTEGEGIVTMLHCSNCNANVEYCLRTDIEEDSEE